jgi:hypothetical protein
MVVIMAQVLHLVELPSPISLDCIGGTARDSTVGADAFHIKTLTTRTRYKGTSWRTDHHTRRLESSELIKEAHITDPNQNEGRSKAEKIGQVGSVRSSHGSFRPAAHVMSTSLSWSKRKSHG